MRKATDLVSLLHWVLHLAPLHQLDDRTSRNATQVIDTLHEAPLERQRKCKDVSTSDRLKAFKPHLHVPESYLEMAHSRDTIEYVQDTC